jgi:hypothetical protein
MDPKNPIVGQFVFDGQEFEAYAVDLPPGACQGMLTTREGFDDACNELIANHPAMSGKAGIAGSEIDDLKLTNERIARIDAFLPALLKAVEMLTETRYVLDDKRQRIILDAAQAVDRRAKKSDDLFARYQKTREYRSAIAKKGLKTREKKVQQANGAGDTESPPA